MGKQVSVELRGELATRVAELTALVMGGASEGEFTYRECARVFAIVSHEFVKGGMDSELAEFLITSEREDSCDELAHAFVAARGFRGCAVSDSVLVSEETAAALAEFAAR